MGLKNDEFPSSAAFDTIQEALSSDEKAKKDAIKSANAIFAFTLKNNAGKEESWHIDMKESGNVGKDVAPVGKKADVTLVLKDSDFQKLVDGKAKAQSMFMTGSLKIKGNVMKATKMEPILNKAQASKAKL